MDSQAQNNINTWNSKRVILDSVIQAHFYVAPDLEYLKFRNFNSRISDLLGQSNFCCAPSLTELFFFWEKNTSELYQNSLFWRYVCAETYFWKRYFIGHLNLNLLQKYGSRSFDTWKLLWNPAAKIRPKGLDSWTLLLKYGPWTWPCQLKPSSRIWPLDNATWNPVSEMWPLHHVI